MNELEACSLYQNDNFANIKKLTNLKNLKNY